MTPRRPAPPARPLARPPARRRPRLSRSVWVAVVSVVLIGVLFLGVYPTRTYLAQRASASAATEQLGVLERQNDELAQRITALRTDAEVERLAREQFNLVDPGEEAFVVLPPPGPPLVDLPERWPFTGVEERLAP